MGCLVVDELLVAELLRLGGELAGGSGGAVDEPSESCGESEAHPAAPMPTPVSATARKAASTPVRPEAPVTP
jgi:hypothetical protein